MKFKILILFLVIFAAGFLIRSWKLEEVPPGLNVDEVSEGYNAYSLLKTGRDRYGMTLPITFKSYGSYQPPLYTYLTILPVYLFGSTIFAVKVVTLISGLLVIIFTFLIIKEFWKDKKGSSTALFAALIVAIAPWAIFFSRIATEASLSVALFTAGFYLTLKSLKNFKLFPFACLVLGLSTHAYYSERIVSLLFLLGFTLLNWKQFIKNKNWLILGLAVFGLTQVPHLLILKSGAFTRRLEQVSYLSTQAFETNGIAFKDVPFGRALFVVREFSSQYLAYFSPRNLFFQPDDQGARAIPDLSVFFNWMIFPWLVGLGMLIKNRKNFLFRSLLMLMIIAPIPAALSTDPFYTLRVLVLLWVLSVIISVGSMRILGGIRSQSLKLAIFVFVIAVSLLTFYIHYFGLFKHERGETVSYSSMELIKITQEKPDREFVVDLTRDVALGIRFAYFRKYDPASFQKREGAPFLKEYYNSVDYEKEYKMHNIEIRPINWEDDVYKDQILVGDILAISQGQVDEHKLKLEFEIKDLTADVVLKGYSTNPREKCLSLKGPNIYCKQI